VVLQEAVPVTDINDLVPGSMNLEGPVRLAAHLEAEALDHLEAKRILQAAACFEQAIHLRHKVLGELHLEFHKAIERYVCLCNQWATNSLHAGQSSIALELLKKAESMVEVTNAPYQRQTLLRAMTLNNLCCYYRSRGKMHAAMQYAEKALRIRRKNKDLDNGPLIELNSAVLLSQGRRHAEAIDLISSALTVLTEEEHQLVENLKARHLEARRGLPVSSEADEAQRRLAWMVAAAHHNMWHEMNSCGNHRGAAECIRRSVNVARWRLGRTDPLTARVETALEFAEAQLASNHQSSSQDLEGEIIATTRTTRLPSLTPGSSTGTAWKRGWTRDSAVYTLAERQQITPRVLMTGRAHLRPCNHLGGDSNRLPEGSPRLRVQVPRDRAGTLSFDAPRKARPRVGKLGATYCVGSPQMQQEAHGVHPMMVLQRGGISAAAALALAADEDAAAAIAAERLQAIGTVRNQWAQRHDQGLPAPGTENCERAATLIQAQYRGKAVRKGIRDRAEQESSPAKLEEPTPSAAEPTERADAPEGPPT